MKKYHLLAILFTVINCYAQKAVDRQYKTANGSEVTVFKDGSISEKWEGSKGEINVISKDSNGKTTTEIYHKDGTKEVNGVKVDNSTTVRPDVSKPELPKPRVEHNTADPVTPDPVTPDPPEPVTPDPPDPNTTEPSHIEPGKKGGGDF